MRRTNCLFFALWLWITRGGYLVVRKSRHVTGWHWLWSRDSRMRLIHYEPILPKELPPVLWHKIWYQGRIKRGDK